MDKWFRRIDTLLLLGALSFVLFFVMPAFFGIRPVRVLSGSMKPEIVEGDMVYIQSCREEDVQTGDVIAFENGNGQMVLHRVIRREEEGFITKGDANDREDFQLVSAEDLIGILAVRFPKGSWLYEMMSSKTMRRVLLLSGLVRIVVYFFRRFSR